MNVPRVGIVVPSYNAARFITRTIDSVREQDWADWECVVVDDGSTDGTPEIVAGICAIESRLRLVVQVNSGVAAARTLGFSLLSPSVDFVVFMDNDDLFLPGAFRRLVEAIESRPGCVGAHGLADMIDSHDRPIGDGGFAQFLRERRRVEGHRLVLCRLDEPTTFDVVLVTVFWPPGTVMLRRDVIAGAGSFDTTLRAASDWDMWIRVARQGPLVFLNEMVVKYRRHDANESNEPEYIYREARFVRRKAYFAKQNTSEQRTCARNAYRAWQLHKIDEKQRLMRSAIRCGDLTQVVRSAVHILGHLLFYIRGYPTLLG